MSRFFIVAAGIIGGGLATWIWRRARGVAPVPYWAQGVGIVLAMAIASTAINTRPALPPPLGLDAPFIVNAQDPLEAFPQRIAGAPQGLPKEDALRLKNAFGFLALAITATATPTTAEPETVADAQARYLVRLHRFATAQGPTMTLRHFIVLADSLRQLRPDLARAYDSLRTLPANDLK